MARKRNCKSAIIRETPTKIHGKNRIFDGIILRCFTNAITVVVHTLLHFLPSKPINACLLSLLLTLIPTVQMAQTTSSSGALSGTTTATIRPNLPDTAATVRIAIRTTLGVFEAELYRRAAPATVENFLRYVTGGYYTGGLIHRTVKKDNQPDKPDSIKIEVIQATIGSLYAQYALPPIEIETTRQSGLKHLDGTLSMARDEPNTAQYEFFICIGDQPQLNFGGKRNPDGQGFAAFGRVIKGMDIVRKIQQSRAAGQALMPPIMIIGITRKT